VICGQFLSLPVPRIAAAASIRSAQALMPLSIRLAIGGSPNCMNSLQKRFAGCARDSYDQARLAVRATGLSNYDHVLSGFVQSNHLLASDACTLKASNSLIGSSMPNAEFMLKAQSPTAKCWYSSSTWSTL
jgi:hypothetical protein